MSARSELLRRLREDVHRPLSKDEIFEEFEIAKDQRQMFSDLLLDLIKSGQIFKNSQGLYGVPEKFNLIGGRIEKTASGNAFLIPDDPEKDDIYIASANMNGAMHNDKVFVRPVHSDRGKSQAGEVAEIIERVNKKIVGNLEKYKNYGFLIPDNNRICNDVFIPPEALNKAENGQKVVAKITRWPEKNRNPEGEIIEILGDKDDPGVDIEAIIRQLDLPGEFPDKVLSQIKNIPDEVSDARVKKDDERQDLRDLKLVTIDGSDAKDLDDAVSIEKLDSEVYRLGVHIADVSHYVTEDSPLDSEAYSRATSIYLVDRVIPMLPEKLSNGICSLNPRVDRLTMTVFIDYRLQGKNGIEIIDHDITKSVINSNHRLTYDAVQNILEDKESQERQQYSDFVEELEMMNELRRRLRRHRFAEGSMDFNFTEVKVELDEEGHPIDLKKRRHREAEQLIEEFMIAANRIVAAEMSWRDMPFIYRVHEEPDLDRMQQFNEFIHNFGYSLKGVKNGVHPRALQEILEDVRGTKEEKIIETVMLRSLKKAVYSDKNIGHFGLGISHYSHFTSPIRRYPDLTAHRIIKETITEGYLSEERQDELDSELPKIADHCSLQERRAMDAERDSVDLKKIEFMEDKIGDEFEGIISGITGFGIFVELENTVEGLVHIKNLRDDYYHYDEEKYHLIGERTKKIYRIGDQVKIKVAKVNRDERQLDFELLEKLD
ncbi:ribonuclease R [Halanaerobium sp. ST460_2HS_T2]|uniref:ribonuclease R n=1 Tax=Halanaerobium sp. ST460_2HS_T2 TaxID=2183914 RepID=UPI000DE779E2|nr:ribonuclease R [Halanaerobium sp. ST460_2HS_T2]PUU92459.1 MAG: ribonuclease R [Halanaerobium sp.]RCW60209.1 RNAse R [Halanaerobium sp. ST460_2HS_T2]